MGKCSKAFFSETTNMIKAKLYMYVNTKFVKDLPMIDAQLRFNQCNSFREENISVFSHMVLC
jgi:hypothetical protein